MATLKPYQVAAAALLGGFPPGEVPTAVAVAKGESGYSTTSRNACCSGLWQIHRTAHADKIRAAGGEAKLTDPVVNASLAKQVWAGDWCNGRAPNGHCNKFEAYQLGNAGMSWQAKMTEGAKAYAEVQRRQAAGETLAAMAGSTGAAGAANAAGPFGPDNPLDAVMDTGKAIAAVGKAIIDFGNKIAAWVSDPNSWLRVAQVIGGGMLVAVGLRITFNTQINAVTKEAISWVLPGGKASKLAGKARGATGAAQAVKGAA